MATPEEIKLKEEKDLEIARRRFSVQFYTIHDHLRDPNYPYTVGASMISSGNARPPVIGIKKITEAELRQISNLT